MLNIMNQFCNGLLAVPAVALWKKHELDRVLSLSPATADELALRVRANPGALHVVMRVLFELELLEQRAGRFEPTALLRDFDVSGIDWSELLRFDFRSCWFEARDAARLADWMGRLSVLIETNDERLERHLVAAFLVPGLLGLTEEPLDRGGFAAVLRRVPEHPRRLLTDLLRRAQLVQHGTDAAVQLTDLGEFIFSRLLNLGIVGSYASMLSRLEQLTFGNYAEVFSSAHGDEVHVERKLNVIASGFAHEKFFKRTEEILIGIFDNSDLASQPKYVADMGCGDGTFLKRIYTTVLEKTCRGKALDRFPLTLLACDYSPVSLQQTQLTLAGLPHLAIHADIGDPGTLLQDLKARGVADPERILHVRSFLDHDRPLRAEPIDPHSWDAGRERTNRELLAIGPDGSRLEPGTVVQDLERHLARWRDTVSEHGLLLLEVHSLEPQYVRKYADQIESLWFDACQTLSKQLLVGADTFIASAARVGLFADPRTSEVFPKSYPFVRVTLNHFVKRGYAIRCATSADLEQLLEIEDLCWNELRGTRAEIAARIERFPEGQLVLETANGIAGVLYCQRIADWRALERTRHAELPKLHDPHGAFLQLLGLSIHPREQGAGLADELLQYGLSLARVLPGVESVFGVTRCRDFSKRRDPESTIAQYLQQTDARGVPNDPIVGFHVAKGAKIRAVVAEFRVEDVNGGGFGVLIEHALNRSFADVGADSGGATSRDSVDVAKAVRGACELFLREKKRAYEDDLSFKDAGFDSLDLMALRRVLGITFGIELESSFLFQYSTPRQVIHFLEAERRGGQASTKSASQPTRNDMAAPTHVDVDRAADRRAAIIGMACRFPHARTPAEYFDVLRSGQDVVGDAVSERWGMASLDVIPQRLLGAVRKVGLIDGHTAFDERFFRISPKEAGFMDPQQRLLLEHTWLALEDAGIDPETLRGTRVGVFVGCHSHDAERLFAGHGTAGGYYGSGTATSILAGRIAYFFDWSGPVVTVDTACSSSLYALRMAERELLADQCDLAIVAGINLVLSPELSVSYAEAGMLSPTGSCKTFDARADGYVRSEGVAVCVLKRADIAKRAGNRIYARLLGTAVNHDGHSNGLTAPNPAAQVELLRSALTNAGISPTDVDLLEAHGTGTSLGDPVEVSALCAVFGGDRAGAPPIRLGSVKSNIGHTEAVAGLAGVLKVALSFERELIPGNLHFKELNPNIREDLRNVRIITDNTEWPRGSRRRRAAVSSFGFSGSNAHVILEEENTHEDRSEPADALHSVCVSAPTVPALQRLLGDYARLLESSRDQLADVAFTSSVGRQHFAHRVCVRAADGADAARLLASSAGEAKLAAAQYRDVSGLASPRVAFLFSGQGSQYPGMGRQLYEREPIFRGAFERCALRYQKATGEALAEVVWGSKSSLLGRTEFTQPALFSLQYSLAALWMECGVVPSVVMGHSIGEYAAACCAGYLDLDAAMHLICQRGKLMHELTSGGSMAAVLSPLSEVHPYLEGYRELSVAAVNAPAQTVLSGASLQLERCLKRLTAAGITSIPLDVSHAFHSPLMQPMLGAFQQEAERCVFTGPKLDMISTLASERRPAACFDNAEYWTHHVGGTVDFLGGMRELARRPLDYLLEVGAGNTLQQLAKKCLPSDSSLKLLGSLRREDTRSDTFSGTLAELHLAGAKIDWAAYHRGKGRRVVALPHYPFDYRPYPLPAVVQRKEPEVIEARAVDGASEPRLTLSVESMPELAGHRVRGEVLVPAALFVRLLLERRPTPTAILRELVIARSIAIDEQRTTVQVRAERGVGQSSRVMLESERAGVSESCANAEFTDGGHGSLLAELNPPTLGAGSERGAAGAIYEALASRGLVFSGAFRSLEFAEFDSALHWARGQLANFERGSQLSDAVVLDAGLQLLLLLSTRLDPEQNDRLFIPFSIATVEVKGNLAAVRDCWARIDSRTERSFTGTVLLLDEQKSPIAALGGVVFRRAPDKASVAVPAGRSLRQLSWRQTPTTGQRARASQRIVIFDDSAGNGTKLAGALRAQSHHCILARVGEQFENQGDCWRIRATEPSDLRQLCAGLGPVQQIAFFCSDVGDRSEPRSSALDAIQRQVRPVFELLRHCVAEPWAGLERLTVVSRGVLDSPDESRLALAPLVGLIRTALLETSAFELRHVDLDEMSTSLLVSELEQAGSKPAQIAYRNGVRLSASDVELPAPPLEARTPTAGTVLITGGAGYLGMLSARWLLDAGYRHLVLCSRQASPEALRQIALWNADPVSVRFESLDIGDGAALADLLQRIESSGSPLCGVIHAAGTLRDKALVNQTWLDVEHVTRAKIQGAVNLHTLTRHCPLDFFVMYSSVTALQGNAGQANYAMANAYLDGLANVRRAQGLPGTSICWGPFDGGMARPGRLSRKLSGFRRLSESDGEALLLAALGGGTALPPVLGAYLFEDDGAGGGRSATGSRTAPVTKTAPSNGDRSGPETNHELLRRIVAEALDLKDPWAVQDDDTLEQWGLDSIASVEIRDELGAALGRSLPASLLFDFPTLRRLTGYLESLSTPAFDSQALGSALKRAENEATGTVEDDGIAIVGMSCRFPGSSNNPEQFWELLQGGKTGVVEMTNERWRADRFYDADVLAAGKANTKSFGLLDNVRDFDAEFFNISPTEAAVLDPQQRLLLEVVHEAVEDAGYSIESMAGREVGVFLGIMNRDYVYLNHRDVIGEGAKHSAYYASGQHFSAAAGRVAYFFDWTGPTLAVDTACSSSLVALHLACQSLRAGESEQAVVAGVNLILTPEATIESANANMLSASGRCHAFDARADGYVRSEGCGALVLKPLRAARAAGDTVLAVVRATAVNQDGRSQGLTAPNGEAQRRLLRTALRKARLNADQISFVEAHGTGTPLGDPIEIHALQDVYLEGRRPDNPLYVSSVKTNIGHAESAAGVAGLIKSILMLNKRKLAPHADFERLNPHITWNAELARIPQRLLEWGAEHETLHCGVSAFGFSGTNAHAILTGASARKVAQTAGRHLASEPMLYKFSAKSARSLKLKLERFVVWLAGQSEPRLDDICFTLNCGRDDFAFRFACVASDRDELLVKVGRAARSADSAWSDVRAVRPRFALDTSSATALTETIPESLLERLRTTTAAPTEDAFADFGNAADLVRCYAALGVTFGDVGGSLSRGGEPTLVLSSEGAFLENLARAYCAGAKLRWERLHGKPAMRVALPTYEYERRTHWIEREPYASPSNGRACYERQWVPVALEGAAFETNTRVTLYVALEPSAAFEGVIGARGMHYVALPATMGLEHQRESLTAAFRRKPYARVVVDARFERSDRNAAADALLFLSLAQLVEREGRGVVDQVVLLTCGLHVPGVSGGGSVSGAALAGVLKVLEQENPSISILQIDADSSFDLGDLDAELAQAASGHDLVVWRGGRRLLPKMQARDVSSPLALDGEGVVLITGGTSGLGLMTAQVLAERGARHLVLVSRNGAKNEQDRSAIEALRGAGTRVDLALVDVADADAVERLLADLRRNHRLRGIVHAAGVIQDAVIANQTDDGFRRTLAAKAQGAWNLHRSSLATELEFFVMYSSVSSIIGTPGQSNYAAANAFLDALAGYRRSRGLRALSINWGAWEDVGAVKDPWLKDQLRKSGIGLIQLDEGRALIRDAMGVDAQQLLIAPLDFEQFFKSRKAKWEFANLWSGGSSPATPPDEALVRFDLGALTSASSEGEARSRLKRYLRELVVKLLGKGSEDIGDHVGFTEMGMDSLMATRMRRAIQAGTGLELAPTLLFEQPSVESLSGHLLGALALSGRASLADDADDADDDRSDAEALAQLQNELYGS